MLYFHLGDSNSDHSKLLDAISTREGILQAISDLFAIVKAQPKYQSLNDDRFSESSDPMDVLMWVLRKLGPLAKGRDWTVDTYRQGGKTRFCFVIYRHYTGSSGFGSNNGFKPSEKHISLDFLPFLLKRDRGLHDLIIEVVALVSRNCDIPLWDRDGDFSEALASLKSILPVNQHVENQKRIYTSGPAAEYLRILNQRRKVATARSVLAKLNGYCHPAERSELSQRLRWVLNWVDYGIALSSYKTNIDAFTYIPNYRKTGQEVTPRRQYKIVWSVHNMDYVYGKADSKINRDTGDHYQYRPAYFSVTRPGELVEPLANEFPDFPIMLSQWMNEGELIFRSHHREYFYKHTMSDRGITPAESLLEKIELSEFKKMLHE